MRYNASGVALLGLMVAGNMALSLALAPVATAQDGTTRPPASNPTVQFQGIAPDACLYVPFFTDYPITSGKPDPLGYAPEKDVVTSRAVTAVKQCTQVYGGTSANAWQFLAVARAQLAMGNDAEAKAMDEKYLAFVATSSIERRAWAQHLIAVDYAEAQPARMAEAQAAIAKLDAMGTPAARVRLVAHGTMASAALRQWNDELAVREASAAVVAYKELTGGVRDMMMGQAAGQFFVKAEIALRHQGGDAARAILDSGLALFPKGSGAWRGLKFQRDMDEVVNKPAKALEAKRWFHRKDTAAKPAHGVVTLLSYAEHGCSTPCEPRYQALQRLDKRFAGKPFEIINFTKTIGFFADSAPMPPATEILMDSNYFYGYAKIPGPLAVYETDYAFRIDSRRSDKPTPQDINYAHATIVLIDKQGIIRYVRGGAGWNPVLDEPLAKFMEMLIAEK